MLGFNDGDFQLGHQNNATGAGIGQLGGSQNSEFWKQEDDGDDDDDDTNPQDLPLFQWDQDHLKYEDARLKVSYPGGRHEDVAMLKSWDPIPDAPDNQVEPVDPCIFKGNLETRALVRVTLNGCPGNDSFEVRKENKGWYDTSAAACV